MPEKHRGSFFDSIVSVLISLGTPPLFFLKILLWTVIWIGQKTSSLSLTVIELTIESSKTALWFTKNLYGFAAEALLRFLEVVENTISFALGRIRTLSRLMVKTMQRRTREPRVITKVQPTSSIQKLRPGVRELIIFSAGVLATGAFIYVRLALSELPNPKTLAYRDIPVTTRIYDRNGILLYQIYTQENRSLVKLDNIPQSVINATVAFEDKNFYHHIGLDFRGIVRAAFANASGQPVQGGSTITQQLVKSALLTSERTWERKLKELLLSLWTERIYSKKEILEMYFNQVPYGGEVYGIEAAAQTYFGKKAGQLTLAESALLAALPSSPTAYSPFGSHPERAREKQREVLDAMVSGRYISQFTAGSAKNEEIHFKNPATVIKAPHFVMYVKDYLINKYGQKTVEQGGLDVYTSLDYKVYEIVLSKINEGVEKQKYLNVGNGAALVVNPKTGEILAMVGSMDYFDTARDGNVNVTLAQRSPGSSIKPLTYALALEKKIITPGTIIDDAPVVYRPIGSQPYAPQNYDNRFHGRVTVRTALASSLNIPAVKIADKLGVSVLINKAPEFGIASWQDPSRYGLSLTLGGGEVTLLEMAQLFSVLANGGNRVDLNPIIKVTDYRGHVLEDHTNKPKSKRVLSPQTAFFISDILADNQARSLTFGPNSALVIPGKTVSVKTGTTQEKRDNLTFGYTPSLVAAVWVGNNDNSPMSPYLESGNTGAAAIWNPIMTELLKDSPNEPISRPDNIVEVRVCTINGLLACENCPSVKTEYFAKGTEPATACNFTKDDLEKFNKEREEQQK